MISYANNRFPEDYIPTVFDNYVVNLTAGEQTIELGLWDTAGLFYFFFFITLCIMFHKKLCSIDF